MTTLPFSPTPPAPSLPVVTRPVSGWRSSEFCVVAAVVLAAIAVLLFKTNPHLQEMALAVAPLAAGWYAKHRTDLKKLAALSLTQSARGQSIVDRTLSEIVGAFSPLYRTSLNRLTGAPMSAVPQTTAEVVPQAAPAADPILAAAAATIEGVLANSIRKAADGVASRLGVTDPATVAKFEAAFANGAAALIESLEPLAGKLLGKAGL